MAIRAPDGANNSQKKRFFFGAKRQRCNICNISAIFRPVALWWVGYFVALTQFGRYKRQNRSMRHMIYTPCSDVWNYRWKWSWGVVISNCDFLFNVAKFHGKKLFHLNLSMIPPYCSHLNILYLCVWKGWSHRRSLSYYWWGSNSVFHKYPWNLLFTIFPEIL